MSRIQVFLSLILLQFTVIILIFFFGGMSYGLLDLADLQHSDDLTEKFLVCWLVFGLLVLIGLNTERIESNDSLRFDRCSYILDVSSS
jgi:hypothetical protein